MTTPKERADRRARVKGLYEAERRLVQWARRERKKVRWEPTVRLATPAQRKESLIPYAHDRPCSMRRSKWKRPGVPRIHPAATSIHEMSKRLVGEA